MITKSILYQYLLLCLTVLFACTNSEKDRPLTIATAANMQFAMTELADKFTEQTEVPCELIVSSSGKLTAQIKEGAPYDVLFSADMKYPKEIENSGLAVVPPSVYAFGKLALWSADENIEPSIDLLTSEEIEHIAIANPKTAPYGAAAIEVLKHYKIYDAVQAKLVFGESIAQTNQFITSRAAEIGFTAKSVVLAPEMKEQGNWIELEAETYSPVEQGIAIINRGKQIHPASPDFYQFIFSDEATEILTNFGYSIE